MVDVTAADEQRDRIKHLEGRVAQMEKTLRATHEALGSARLIIRAADRVADGVRLAVEIGLLGSRTKAADALLDYDDLADHRAALALVPPPEELFGRDTFKRGPNDIIIG